MNTEMDFKISVVIPMYNSMDTITNTLDSIKNQTAFDYIFEVIVVNDGSKDKSLEVVARYREENKNMPIIIIDKENGGVSTARNTGIERAQGNWIALLDSDDNWVPTKIETQVKVLKENPDIDFLGAGINEGALRILWKKVDQLYKASITDLCLKMFPQSSTVIFRKSIFEKIGGYDEKQTHAEDGKFYLKICSRYNYYYLPIKLVEYGGGKPRFGFSGLSSNLKKMHEGNVKNIKELSENSMISKKFYVFLRIFYWMKYIRRIIITNFIMTRDKNDEIL